MSKKLTQPNIGLFESTKWRNCPIVYKRRMLFDKFNDENRSIPHRRNRRLKYENKASFSTNHRLKKERKSLHKKHKTSQSKTRTSISLVYFILCCLFGKRITWWHSVIPDILSRVVFFFILLFSRRFAFVVYSTGSFCRHTWTESNKHTTLLSDRTKTFLCCTMQFDRCAIT